ncbi:MAG: T9SS type A sorting domain-containing protein, partial [Chitinophagaceae bacterium]
NNGGSGQYIGVPDVQFVPYGNGYYAEFMASGFSEFWLTKSNAGPVIDAALTALVSPAQQSCYGATETVSFTLKNNGNATLDFAVTPVTINAAVTGPNAQTFAPLVVNSGTLAAGASQTVTVSTSYNMSAVGTYGFSASASISGDINPGNNSIATVQRTVEALIAGTVSGNVAGYCGTGGTPTMTVSGGPYTSIQWQEGSSASGPWTNVGTNASTYTPATVITASTWYRAIVQCGAQSATTAPTSVLLAAPEVISTTPVTTCGNSVISVTATASNGASISWYDAPVGGNLLGTGTHLVQTISATTTYYAEASEGSCRSARVAVVATVQAATAVTTEPTDVMACTSMPATFTVAATGSGTLSYQWRKVGSPIPGANAATYTIGSITSGDYGSYDVIVTGDCGSDTSAAVTLQICTAVSTTDLTINHAALSPVPAHNHATLRVTAARATRIEWSIIDNKGLVVRRFSQRVMAGDNTLALSLADLSAGTYLLSGTTDKGKITVIRFVKL